jgi:hypothetical protein
VLAAIKCAAAVFAARARTTVKATAMVSREASGLQASE